MLAVALVVALLLASCTGDDPGGGATTPTDGGPAGATEGGPAGPTAPERAPLDDDAMAVLGAALLDAADARSSVRTDEGAELQLAQLARTYCDTARRSDLDNASTTFRYSLAEFFGSHGVVPAVGEPQDATLALAMLAGTWGEALEVAARDQICPDLG